MEGERFDEVLPETAGLRLQSRSDVSLQLTLLTLDGPNLNLQPVGVVTPEGGQEEVPALQVRPPHTGASGCGTRR